MDWPVRVEITLKDGSVFSERLDKVTGCPNRPMTDDELVRKFIDNTKGRIGEENSKKVQRMLMGIENVSTVNEVLELLIPLN